MYYSHMYKDDPTSMEITNFLEIFDSLYLRLWAAFIVISLLLWVIGHSPFCDVRAVGILLFGVLGVVNTVTIIYYCYNQGL